MSQPATQTTLLSAIDKPATLLSAIDKPATVASIMKQLTAHAATNKKRIKADHHDFAWLLVTMVDNKLKVLPPKQLSKAIKQANFSCSFYKKNLPALLSDHNKTQQISCKTIGRYFKLFSDAGIISEFAPKPVHLGTDYEAGKAYFVNGETTVRISLELVVISAEIGSKGKGSKKPFFKPIEGTKCPPYTNIDLNKKIIKSEAAFSNFENSKISSPVGGEKKGAVRKGTRQPEQLTDAQVGSEKEKSCAKKEKRRLTAPDSPAGLLWQQLADTLYPNWSINEDSQNDAVAQLQGYLEASEAVIAAYHYKKVANGVEKFRQNQRDRYLAATTDSEREKIAAYVRFKEEGVRQYLQQRLPNSQKQAYILISRAIQKAKSYSQKRNFEQKIYPTKYLAEHFPKAIKWATTEYMTTQQQRQDAPEMLQLAKLRAQLYAHTQRVIFSSNIKNQIHINSSELMQRAYEASKSELSRYAQTQCWLLSAPVLQQYLQDFETQIKPVLGSLKQPETASKQPQNSLKQPQNSLKQPETACLTYNELIATAQDELAVLVERVELLKSEKANPDDIKLVKSATVNNLLQLAQRSLREQAISKVLYQQFLQFLKSYNPPKR